jgi:hypothetical protein
LGVEPTVSLILTMNGAAWAAPVDAETADGATAALESGAVLWFPALTFDTTVRERQLFTAVSAARKNISFDPVNRIVRGAAVSADGSDVLQQLLARFSESASTLMGSLFPDYRQALHRARASFRPAEIAGRATSWRKDDSRLHIDSFPATPVQGRRILRVFTNVNPEGRPRSWRVGEDFNAVVARFGGGLRLPLPGSASIRRLVGLTKSRRSPYDSLMLQLHDSMKADAAYQRDAPQRPFDFAAGTTWIAFTDEVSHAAMAGRHQLEQTFLLPVIAMRAPERSPLYLLERLKAKPLG